MLLILLGSSIFFKMERWRAGWELEQVIAHLDSTDQGWRLEDIEAARRTIPDERNSARIVVTAFGLMPQGGLIHQALKPLEKKPYPPQLLDKTRASLLERELKPFTKALIAARRVADMPQGRHRLEYAPNPLEMELLDEQKTVAVGSLLRYDVWNLAQKGETRAALRSCQAILNVGRSIGDEPIMVSQFIRAGLVSIHADWLERVLALGEPPLEDLASLQSLLAEEESHPSLLIALRGERAIQHLISTGLANGSLSAGADVWNRNSRFNWPPPLAQWDTAHTACLEHPRLLELLSRAIAAANLPADQQMVAERASQIDNDLSKLAVRGTILTAKLTSALQTLPKATRRKLAQVRCLQVLLALERYRRSSGDWPVDLKDLTPELINGVPIDPFDGQPIRYKRLGTARNLLEEIAIDKIRARCDIQRA
jgi:hypothetical protein